MHCLKNNVCICYNLDLECPPKAVSYTPHSGRWWNLQKQLLALGSEVIRDAVLKGYWGAGLFPCLYSSPTKSWICLHHTHAPALRYSTTSPEQQGQMILVSSKPWAKVIMVLALPLSLFKVWQPLSLWTQCLGCQAHVILPGLISCHLFQDLVLNHLTIIIAEVRKPYCTG